MTPHERRRQEHEERGVIRVLTLTQPWATLMALGLKTIETRSWGTRYRGPLAIHAAKGWNPFAGSFAHDLVQRKIIPDELPFGQILVLVKLDDVVKVTPQYLKSDSFIASDRKLEREFGNYTVDRFAWHTSNRRPLKQPLDWKGGQGLRKMKLEALDGLL